MISTNQFKNGMCIMVDSKLYEIVEFQHVKPGKGGAFVRTKLKNVDNGAVVDKTFRAGEKFEQAHMQKKEMQYLYSDGSSLHFMDNENYEQISLSKDQVGDAVNFMTDGMNVDILFHDNKPIDVTPPISVELKVTKAEPGHKGDTATGGTKPVEVETGLKVNVPMFVNEGDTIKVDSRNGQYVTRVS